MANRQGNVLGGFTAMTLPCFPPKGQLEVQTKRYSFVADANGGHLSAGRGVGGVSLNSIPLLPFIPIHNAQEIEYLLQDDTVYRPTC